MAFAQWKSKKSQVATATLATVATHEGKSGDFLPSVASVATVAVAEGENHKVFEVHHDDEFIALPTDFRVDNPVISANIINESASNDHDEPTASELLAWREESLFNHLLDCSICHIERGEYCLQGNERGQAYDEILLQFDDPQAKRANLALHIDRKLISGRRAFVSLDHGNRSTSQQQAVKSLIVPMA